MTLSASALPSSRRYGALAAFLVVTFAAAAIGSASTFRSVTTWYPTLAKPAWNPPSWVFGPVWTVLYIAMAVGAWRCWRLVNRAEAASLARLYGGQLALNALWSVLFFGLHRPAWALFDILLLWLVLVVLLRRFWRIDRAAGAMWSAYVAWVSFATALNAAIWVLNRP